MTRETLEYWRASARASNAMTLELIEFVVAQQERLTLLEADLATVSKLLELLPAEIWELR